MDASGGIIEKGAIAIDRGKIVAVGTRDELKRDYAADRIIEADRKVILPGFICTHTHMASVLSHNMMCNINPSEFKEFMDILSKYWWPMVEDPSTKEDIYYGTRFAALKMLKSGTTCVADMVEGPNALPGILNASARAIEDLGIRAVIGNEVSERPVVNPKTGKTDVANATEGMKENIRFVEKKNKEDGLVKGRFALHSAYTCSPELLEKARQLADKHKTGILIHVAEIPPKLLQEKYGKTAPQLMEDVGFLSPDVLAAHCIHLSDADLEIFRKNDVKIAHTPMSNAYAGLTVARVPDMLEAGITVSLGHDCFFTMDILDCMRWTFLVHKQHRLNPTLLTADQVLEIATVNGAKALQMEKEIGSLKPGKKADLIIVDPKCPTPINKNTLSNVIISDMNGADVNTAIVDGKIIMENRKLNTVDEQEVLESCVERATDLWERNQKMFPKLWY
jgi:5-methylthioadenosine/S-adenosylhomocysteine deaminase